MPQESVDRDDALTPLATDEIGGCRDRDNRKEEKRHPASCAKVAVRGRPFADRAVELPMIDQRVARSPSEDEHFLNSSQKDPTQTVQNKDGDWKLMPTALLAIRHANVSRPRAGGFISPRAARSDRNQGIEYRESALATNILRSSQIPIQQPKETAAFTPLHRGSPK